MKEDVAVGILVVVMSVSAVFAATRYDGDGTLTNRLEYQRWYINRARFAPEMEADRLSLVNTSPGGSPDYDVCEDTTDANDFGTTTNCYTICLPSGFRY